MKKVIIVALVLSYLMPAQSQKYFTRDGKISFLSDTPMEEIKATNGKATSVLDIESGAIEWAVLINAFKFKKALMEEHFNENYMESTKYPKATFKGVILDIDKLPLDQNADYDATVEGVLEIRGIKKTVSSPIKLAINSGKIIGTSEIKILVADFDIEIPKVVRDNIAKEVTISISADYELLK